MSSRGSGPSVVVVGTGMHAGHLTADAIAALRTSDVIMHLITDTTLVALLDDLGDRVIDLVPLYEEGAIDLDVYHRIVGAVLDETGGGRRVALAIVGHPSVYAAPTQMLARIGPERGIPVDVLPGVSSIDALLTQFPFDISTTGLQLLDANHIVSYGLRPMTDVPLLLLQIGTFGSAVITRLRENDPGRLRTLVEYLAQLYPPTHPVTLLEAQMGPAHTAVETTLPLVELARAGRLVTYNSTLFVPATRRPRVVNPTFHQSLLYAPPEGRPR